MKFRRLTGVGAELITYRLEHPRRLDPVGLLYFYEVAYFYGQFCGG